MFKRAFLIVEVSTRLMPQEISEQISIGKATSKIEWMIDLFDFSSPESVSFLFEGINIKNNTNVAINSPMVIPDIAPAEVISIKVLLRYNATPNPSISLTKDSITCDIAVGIIFTEP